MDTFNFILQQLITSITLGTIYGLMAIGFSMVYGILGMINFAHGQVYMLSAFMNLMFLYLFSSFPLALRLLLSLFLTMLAISCYAFVIERVAYKPLRKSHRLTPLLSALGVSIVLENYAQLVHSSRTRGVESLLNGEWYIAFLGVQLVITYMQALIVILTLIIMVAFTYILFKTKLGRAQRATEEDKLMASLLGINVDNTISITFVIGACIGSLASMVAVLYYGTVDFNMGLIIGIKSFSASVLGGIGSLPGAILGGSIIAIIEVFWASFIDGNTKDIASFALLVIVLIVKPNGLLGAKAVEKV